MVSMHNLSFCHLNTEHADVRPLACLGYEKRTRKSHDKRDGGIENSQGKNHLAEFILKAAAEGRIGSDQG